MGESTNKLSLVSQFDDLCRYGAVFQAGLETDFLKFTRNQELCRTRWLQTEVELKSLQEEYDVTFQELGHWKSNFEEMRSKYQAEQKRRIDAERKLSELAKLFGEVKEVVNRDSTITDQTKERFAMWQGYQPMQAIVEDNSPILSMDYDNTGELLDFNEQFVRESAGSKKRSSSRGRARMSGHTSPKRMRSSPEEVISKARGGGASIVSTTTVNVPANGGDIVATTKLDTFRTAVVPTAPPLPPPVPNVPHRMETRLSGNRQDSIVVTAPQQITTGSENKGGGLYPTKLLEPMILSEMTNNVRINKPNATPRTESTKSLPFRSQNSGTKLNSRAHDFASKTVIRPETCLPCGRRIRFSKQALKCHNCRATCHPECKGNVPLPCVPINHTPSKSKITLANLAPEDPPRVPALIVHCVNEVESRAQEVGLYRLSAPEREVRELKEKFWKGKGAPNMSNVDVHVICALIKDFLRSLDPLVPKLLWKDFIDAAGKSDWNDSLTALYQCIGQLPLPNRDTMAYLILHWQWVAENPAFKMPVKNLATVLGPTVVGFSGLDISGPTMLNEQVSQVKVMEKLLTIPADFWKSFVNKPEDVPLFRNILKPSDLITPDTRSSKTPLQANSTTAFETPRGGTLPRRPATRQQRFFASPSLQP